MAAQDYYQSFQQLPQTAPPAYSSTPPGGGRRPSVAPVQSPYNYSPQPSNHSQPQYLKPILKNSNSHQGHPSPQPWNAQQGSPYPAPALYQGSPLARPSNNNLLAPPTNYALTPSRSKSEPPENRRTSVDPSYERHHHHRRHHSRSRSRSSRSSSRDYRGRDRSGSRSHSRSRSRSRSHHSHHSHHSHSRKQSHSGRDTFIGAGAGGLIGDAIIPGLGTLLGALAGGLGGHEYGERKGKTSRSKSDNGYRDGVTVHSGWVRR